LLPDRGFAEVGEYADHGEDNRTQVVGAVEEQFRRLGIPRPVGGSERDRDAEGVLAMRVL
jgi:hypothetical protein